MPAATGDVYRDVVTNEEQILAAALGDEAERVEHDSLGVAVDSRLSLGELRVQVVAAGLGQRRERVRGGPAPARHGHVYSVDERLVAEVSAPVVGDDERLDRDADRIEPHLLAGAYDDGPEVAGRRSLAATVSTVACISSSTDYFIGIR